MSTRFRSAFILTAISFLCAGLFLTPVDNAQAQMKKIRWKVATQAPKGLGYANMVRDILITHMDEATDGQIKWKVYYGGVMGNDDDYVAKMNIGQLQGGGLTLVGTNLISPEYSVLALPFLFNGFDEVDYIRGPMYPSFDYYFQERGFKLLLWIDQDFDLFYSTKWKYDNLKDWRRAKIISWSGPMEQAWLKALGARPLSIGIVESPSAIRTGVADTNITTGIWQVGTQLYTTTKYINLTKISYRPAALVVTMDAYNKVPQKYRDRMMAVRPDTQDQFNEGTRRDAQSCLEGMAKYGVELVTTPPEVIAEMRKRTMGTWEQNIGTLFPRELLVELLGHLQYYRGGGKQMLEQEALVAASVAAEKSLPKKAEKASAVAEVEITPEIKAVAVATKTPEKENVEAVAEAPGKVQPYEGLPQEKEVIAAAIEKTPERETVQLAKAVETPPVAPAIEKSLEKSEPAEAPALTAKIDQPQEQAEIIVETPDWVKKKVAAAAEQAKKDVHKKQAKEQKTVAKPKYVSTWQVQFDRIKAVQTKLKEMGLYPLKIDGDLGPVSRKGILEYQKMNQLPQTGVIDADLLNSMGID